MVDNRLTKTTIRPDPNGFDEAITTYHYDRNDRLYLETRDDRANGVGVDKSTTYGYGSGAALDATGGNATQQTNQTEWQGTTLGASGTKLLETAIAHDFRTAAGH